MLWKARGSGAWSAVVTNLHLKFVSENQTEFEPLTAKLQLSTRMSLKITMLFSLTVCLCSCQVLHVFYLPGGRLAFENYACVSGIVTYKTRLKKNNVNNCCVSLPSSHVAFVSYLKTAFQPQNRPIEMTYFENLPSL